MAGGILIRADRASLINVQIISKKKFVFIANLNILYIFKNQPFKKCSLVKI